MTPRILSGTYVELWDVRSWRRKLGIGDEATTLAQRIELIVVGGAGSVDNANARLAAFSTLEETGYVVQTALSPPTFAGREILGTPNQVDVANGDGIVGNTTLSLPQDIHTGASPEFQTIRPSLLTPEFVTYVNAIGELDSTGVTADALNTIGLGTPGYFPYWLGGAGGLASTSTIFTDGTFTGVGVDVLGTPITPDTPLHVWVQDFNHSSVTDLLKLDHYDPVGMAAGGGTGMLFAGSSDTVANRDMARIQARWTTATDATRTAVIDWQTVNAGGALTSRMTLSGPGLSFVTVAPPVAAVATAGAAGALTGAYTYKVEYVTANGHTELGTVSNTVNPAGQQVDLTSIPISTDPKVTGRRIFRTAAGNIYYFLLTTINDNTTTTYTDNTADGALEPLLGEGRNFEDNTTGGTLRYNDVRSMFTGDSNTFGGLYAGFNNDAGYHNTFIGGYAGYSNTNGYWLTAVGWGALYYNVGTRAATNTAFGGLSLHNNTDGQANTGSGYRTLYGNTLGDFNTAMGMRAMGQGNTTGSHNTSVGYVSLFDNNGDEMTVMGSLACNGCLTATTSCAIGVESLRFDTAAIACVAVGHGAARGSGAYVAENIVCVGFDAGRNISTGAHGNILIGYKAGDVITTGAYNIVIGRECDPPSATSNNTLCIGNLIYGTGLNDINTNISTGSISIGTKTPNLGGVTRALTVTSLTTGNNIVSLELQGSRLVNNAAFGLVDFYHQATNVASVGGMRGTADDEGLIGFWTRASGGALINHWRIMSDGDLQAEGAGRIETTSSANLTAAAVGGNVILESNHVGIGTTTVNLGSVTKAVTISAGVAGTAIADLEIQGSRTANDAAFGLVYFFHQANAVGAFEAVRGTADDEGYIRVYARATGQALLEQISVRAGREIRFNGDGSIQTTSGIMTLVGTTYVKVTSVLSADTGFRVANAAASGAMLRGDGTNFIPSVSLWPNGATQGDIIFASAANTYINLAKDANATRYLSNTGASNNPAWAQITLTDGVTGVLPVANGGTNASSWTAGSVIFAGAGGTSLAQDNANLFWDDTNNRLGVGTVAPVTTLTSLGKASVRFSNTNSATAPTTVIAGTYIGIGGQEFTLNSYRLIGFGYNSDITLNYFPAYIGYLEGSTSSSTYGDLIFLTRSTSTGTTQPSERMRIDRLGNVGIGTVGTPGALLDLGLAGTTLGVMRMAGSTSGNVTIRPKAIAGTWTLTLPDSDGNLGDMLITDGGGITSWTAPTTVTPSALTKTDDTNITLTLGGSPTVSLLAATSLTLGWSGQLSVARGGTNAATALAAFNNLSPLTTRGDILTRDATNNVRLAIGVANRLLRSDGTDASWAQAVLTTDVTGILPIANGGTNASSYLATNGIVRYDGTRLVSSAIFAIIGNTLLGYDAVTPTNPTIFAAGSTFDGIIAGALSLENSSAAATSAAGMSIVWELSDTGSNAYEAIALVGKKLNSWTAVAATRTAELSFRIYTEGVQSRALTLVYDNVICGADATSTTRINDFLHIPSSAGNPTGVVTEHGSRVPMVYDTSNNELFCYNPTDNTWRSVVLT